MSRILIQCVVVLYKCTVDESRTLHSLAEFCRQQSNEAQRIALLIFDNSPDPQKYNLDNWKCGAIEYHHAPENGGLAAAYNHALSLAQQAGIEWLLLLDQDTEIDPTLFPALFAAITAPLPSDVCALVPKLVQEGQTLSPQIVARFRRNNLPAGFSGVYSRPVTALNSAACLRVQAVIAVGGFPREYWLDYLDHIMFYRLQKTGGHVMILDICIKHRLSLQNLELEMSIDRYENVLDAEWRFVRDTGADTLVHRARLLKRTISHAIKLRNKAYASRTLLAAFRQLRLA